VPGPDFSDVDTREKAEELCKAGRLEPMLLLPPLFGGEHVPPNIVYVPIGVAAIKESSDRNVIEPAARAGKVTRYKYDLEYEGKSFVPIAIKITASDPGRATATINIWGKVLGRGKT
jgi:hypothetical protein